jgi:high affinity sulfate transporter 1
VAAAPRSLVPVWLHGYRRAWIARDVVAGLVVAGVVVPQAIAYAQIAGLPPQAGLMAAPGALVAYALLGTSRTLVVSATTATSALSAVAVAPLADGDPVRFAALSALLALVTAVVLAAAGALRLGRITDLVSKPVMTGFLFGVGLTVSVGQLSKLLGVDSSSGEFFEQARDLLGELGNTHGWTLVVGLASVALLVVLRALPFNVPESLVVLVLAIVVSSLLGLADRGVEVVGELPAAHPQLAWPDVSLEDALDLLPAALGILVVSAEAVGVSRAIAATHGEHVDPNRDLVALGGSNLLAGLSSGFVQSGGASQTMAAERAGGRTQATTLVAAGVIVLVGAFLTGLFENLPQATLGAIVIVAIAGFFRVDELRRFARLREGAVALSLVALAGVLVFGVLPGLLVATAISLIVVVKRLSRPAVVALGRDPRSGAWLRADLHPAADVPENAVVARVDGPLFYANAVAVEERLLELADAEHPAVLVLELSGSADLDVETLDALDELERRLRAAGVELRLASVRSHALELLRRSGLAERVAIAPTIDAALDRP